MIKRNNRKILWWMYINNKKQPNPVAIDAIKKSCARLNQKNSSLLENLLIKGFSVNLLEGKVRLKPISISSKKLKE